MTTTEKKIDEMYRLIGDIPAAMFTTRRADGSLVSRPMATQERIPDADLYFVTELDSPKVADLANDPHVNAAFFRDRTREWVSVAGVARISRNRSRIRQLYRPDWKAWFGDEGGDRDGGPEDPRIALIMVEAESVEYLVVTEPRPVVLFEIARAMVTGRRPDVGEQHGISGGELLDNR